VHHTKFGTPILRNFVLNICKAQPDWTPQHFIDETIASVRHTLAPAVRCARFRAGVDSAVAATLVDRALRDDHGPSRLTCVFVNNGVLRKNPHQARPLSILRRSARSSATNSSPCSTKKRTKSANRFATRTGPRDRVCSRWGHLSRWSLR